MVGDNRKKARAVFNRLLRTRNLKFGVQDLDIKLHRILDEKKEVITATLEVTNPTSPEAIELIEEFGGPDIIPDTNGQIHFTLKITQGKKEVDQPGQQEIPETESPENQEDSEED